uniref:Uncharacterized protein n=2 Tax=Clastoptera arizonana TaxID=38151 RepID=A0A1B6EGE8_9HEMI
METETNLSAIKQFKSGGDRNVRSNKCEEDEEFISNDVRVYINNKGHKVKTIKIKDEIPHNILQNKTEIRPIKVLKQNSTDKLNKKSPKKANNAIPDENIEPTNELNRFCDDQKNITEFSNSEFEKKEEVENTDLKDEKVPEVQKISTNIKKPNKKTILNDDSQNTPSKPVKTITYNRDEMRAYIKTKRKKEALKKAEEIRLRQQALECQRLKLEQLKEVSQDILKKCVRKTKEEAKPDWWDPKQEEDTEKTNNGLKAPDSLIHVAMKRTKLNSTPAINFTTKLTKAKSKESLVEKNNTKTGPTATENKIQENSDDKNLKSFNTPEDFPNLAKQISKLSNDIKKIQLLQFQNTKYSLIENNDSNEQMKHSTKKSVSSELLPDVKCSGILSSTEKPQLLQSKSWHCIIKKDFHSQGCKLPSDFNYHSSDRNNRTDNVHVLDKDKMDHDTAIKLRPRTCFTSKKIEKPASNKESQYFYNLSQLHSKIKHEPKSVKSNGNQETSTEHIECQTFENEANLEDNVASIPEYMKAFANQPNPFRIINIVKLKLALQKRYQIEQLQELEKNKKTNVKGFEDTEASSIESLEDDFIKLHPPLTMSDLKLNLPASLKSNSTTMNPDLNFLSSDLCPRESLKPSDNSVKSLISSIVSNAPLVIPPSIQSLTLKSKNNTSRPQSPTDSKSLTVVHDLVSPSNSLINKPKPKPEYLQYLATDSELPLQNSNNVHVNSNNMNNPQTEEEGFEIGKVVKSE